MLSRLEGIQAVLFDLYGTLFVSQSGDVGAAREEARESNLREALEAVGIGFLGPVDAGVACLFEAIEASHAESRRQGIEYPEVDIVAIWGHVVAELGRGGILDPRSWTRRELERLAVEFEARANPVWPMSGVRECLGSLRDRGLRMGIVSNAQFYTPELFPALLGQPAESWGFDPRLQYYSYQYGRAKPGIDLHRMACEALARDGVEAGAVLYVGNDMLNDVLPARQVGFRAALFAGDARSLRLWEDDPRVDGLSPDAVLSSLGQLSNRILQ